MSHMFNEVSHYRSYVLKVFSVLCVLWGLFGLDNPRNCFFSVIVLLSWTHSILPSSCAEYYSIQRLKVAMAQIYGSLSMYNVILSNTLSTNSSHLSFPKVHFSFFILMRVPRIFWLFLPLLWSEDCLQVGSQILGFTNFVSLLCNQNTMLLIKYQKIIVQILCYSFQLFVPRVKIS